MWKKSRSGKKIGPVTTASVKRHIPKGPAGFDGSESEYPFYLMLHASLHLDGRGANLPWMQELPDPMTSVVWGTWVEMNPKTAKGLGIKEGDMVSVESPNGRIDAPVYLYPGIRPDTISIPIGQGHRHYGRYARNRGVNPIKLLPFKEDKATGALALNSTRVRISPSKKKGNMVKAEGSTRELGRGISQTISPEKFAKLQSGDYKPKKGAH
jgi:molybdopterin-containing oxidoreductase family iron-sulfur binding subunit